MANLKHIVLDVLKPHQPNILALSNAIAALGKDYRVLIEVLEVDEKTESVLVDITGECLNFKQIEHSIRELGASVHSIDKVLVHGERITTD